MKQPMLPDRLFVQAMLLRAMGLWAGTRILVALLGLPEGTLIVPTGVIASTWMIAVTAILAAVELRRRGDLLLLSSLGHPPVVPVLLSAAPVPLLELAFTATVTS